MLLEYSERLRGALTRITYQAPDGDSAEAMFAQFAAQLQQQSHRVLFECHGRECGSSNAWANQIFDIPKLYGPERYQHYLAAQVDAPQGPLFVALYSIKRGNKRVYTQLDLLQPSDAFRELDANPDMLLAQLKQQGFFELSRLSFDEQDQLTVRGAGLLDSMIVALQKNARLRLYVVGHMYASQTLERLQRRALIRAQAVVDALVEGGIDVERLSAQGVGPLSPDGGKNDRVVLVVNDLF
jgi:outer membrane protein OmpA-like peptidoglycan-associated protein